MKIRFLGRPGCHLCEEARAELESHVAARTETRPGIEIEEINIETDDELHRLYLERIPVIMIDQRVVSEIWFDADALEAALAGHPEGSG